MKKFIKIFAVLFLSLIVLQTPCEYVSAAINTDYYHVTVDESLKKDDGDTTGEVNEATLGDKIMEYIGRFIFSVARLVEILITNFSKWLFGVDAFPWEDLIVFNCLPYLDINFFTSPYTPGSIFAIGEYNQVGDIIRTIYFSLLTLALSVLGIGVSITAIRLAISSIAAEKAKYKEAIGKCLYTVVMLFCVHFLISFLFYMNETIVKAASQMLSAIITAEEEAALQEAIDNVDTDDLYDMVVNNAYGHPDNPSLSGMAGWDVDAIAGKIETKYSEIMSKYYENCSDDLGKSVAAYLLDSDEYCSNRFPQGLYIDEDNEVHGKGILKLEDFSNCQTGMERVMIDVWNIKNHDTLEGLEDEYDGERDTVWYKRVEKAFKKFVSKEGFGQIPNVISSLGEYFRDQADKVRTSDEQLDYVAIVLYAVLLVQSIMLLINYIKRIFYVVLLSLLAPVVIIYDFFMSAI